MLFRSQEKLNQFERNDIWKLVLRPTHQPLIGTKWVYRNKLDEHGMVVRNKAMLVVKYYNQEECINFDKTYTPIVGLESIRMMLAFACFKNFILYQINVKSIFLNGFINEEVFVEQSQCFKNHSFLYHVYKLKKALYGLKQAPRAWYDV